MPPTSDYTNAMYTITCHTVHRYKYVIKKNSPKNKKDLGMACHSPPLEKAKKQAIPILSPTPFKQMYASQEF